MHRSLIPVAAILVMLSLASVAHAHFQTLIPSADIITAEGPRDVTFDIRFTHPMENGPLMNMGQPAQFGVLARGEKQNLLDSLKPVDMQGKRTYKASYTIRRPGDHVFYIEPAPYYEPAEEKMIIHYTKVVVDAMGMEEGWDEPVGFPVEIMPLTRPYGLWAGNVFQGVVTQNGQPVPGATVEVEYLNSDEAVKPPSDPFVTQVVKADERGVFTYAMPRAGWWAFAALIDGDTPMKGPDGKDRDVELGSLIWVKTVDMK